ncbi:MAG: hypothetical protein ACD_3C00003G0002 [uncultured bacterium (gcode 4)]|uniref:Uncharacterized protein n=1 Tax=uncultured bacterium (gcode 4) TaxID=1234023 RepID=K2G0R9_9BACT|nr:MAG: hypothetical protein ACD_3C00003G0002 [uncultured bacterium (gcode 4)]
MFEIPVWDILSSYSGDSKILEFKWEIPDGFYDEFNFTKPLELKIKIIWLDNWVDVVIEKLTTAVKYWDIIKFIDLENIDREFRSNFDPLNPDDIKYINKSGWTIDLKDVIKEEILIQCID